MNKQIALLISTLYIFSLIPTANAYLDVSSSNQNIDAIKFATEQGIIQGYDDGTFKPDNIINRVEFLKILIEGIGITPDINIYNNCFPDVRNEWFAPYVCYAKERNWIEGYPDKTFKPVNTVNKVEAVKMLIETQKFTIPNSVSTKPFNDVSTTDWFSPYIDVAKTKGLLEETGLMFYPSNFMTRANVVEITYRAIIVKQNDLNSFSEYNQETEKETTFDPYSIETLSSNDNNGTSSIILLVDKNISTEELSNSIQTFASDLENESYNVTIKTSNYAKPEEIRNYLKNQYDTLSPKLEGVILFGDIPHAYRVIDDTNNPGGSIREAISFEFYQDLDGTYSKNNLDFPNAYSIHSGNTNSEIWTTILPWQQDKNTTIQKITSYLEKNHNFRNKQTTADGFIEINHHFNADNTEDYAVIIDQMINGQYSWIPSNNPFNTINLFIDNSIGKPNIDDAYFNLSITDRYNVATINSHGNSELIGNLSATWIDNNHISPFFLFLGGCNSGNLDNADPTILVSTIYSENSDVVFAQGTSTFSGGLGTTEDGFYGSNILETFSNNNNIGQSILYHMNSPLIYPWSDNEDLHHGIIILVGDGTLKMKY